MTCSNCGTMALATERPRHADWIKARALDVEVQRIDA
jgi:hypothetical protein